MLSFHFCLLLNLSHCLILFTVHNLLSTVLCLIFYCLLSPSPVVCRLLSVVCRLSSVVCHLSSVVCRLSFVHCLLSTVYCLLSTVYCLLSTVYCLLSTVYCLLSTVYCLLSTVYYLLSTVYCLLSNVYCLLSVFLLIWFEGMVSLHNLSLHGIVEISNLYLEKHLNHGAGRIQGTRFNK